MYVYDAKAVILSLSLNIHHYERMKQWGKMENAIKLLNYVKQHTAPDGTIELTAQQRDDYVCQEVTVF